MAQRRDKLLVVAVGCGVAQYLEKLIQSGAAFRETVAEVGCIDAGNQRRLAAMACRLVSSSSSVRKYAAMPSIARWDAPGLLQSGLRNWP